MFFVFFCVFCFYFFFNDTATTEIYTLSLHDALPISVAEAGADWWMEWVPPGDHRDRKSTRLNSSHITISYAVFCLKKKKKHNNHIKNNKKTKTPKNKQT